MTNSEHPDRLVLHIAGADRTGVTARLTEIIAQEDAALINIGQSVLNGYLMLSAIVDLPKNSYALRKILFAAADMGLRLEVTPFHAAPEATELPESHALAVTLLGPLSNGRATAEITKFMAGSHMNIREIRSLSDNALNGLELIADLPAGTDMKPAELAALRGQFLRLGMELGVDLAVQKDDIFRRTKRLV